MAHRRFSGRQTADDAAATEEMAKVIYNYARTMCSVPRAGGKLPGRWDC